jgi:ketosteroid isomerase-like protein
MNKILLFLLVFLTGLSMRSQTAEQADISALLNQWHLFASKADFEGYFDLLTAEAVFVGTDAAEVWNKQEFMEFSRPYFEQGKAWDFMAIDRNIYMDPSGEVAWFDEILNTWMQLCRGSGVVRKVDGHWKIAHYVLSLTIPNEEINPVITLKRERDSLFSSGLRKQ